MTKGKASMLGAASGAVAGLVARPPACGSVSPMGGIDNGLTTVNPLKDPVHGFRLKDSVAFAHNRERNVHAL
jgi:hypothetical protein